MDGWMDPRNRISLVLPTTIEGIQGIQVEFHLIAEYLFFSFGEWKCRFCGTD
jgi:hypothetical protein